MLYPRTKLITKFWEVLTSTTSQYIALVWVTGVGKSYFVELLKNSEILSEYSVESIFVTNESPLESVTLSNPEANLIFIDSDIILDIDTIRAFIELNSLESKVIFTSESSIEEGALVYYRWGAAYEIILRLPWWRDA